MSILRLLKPYHKAILQILCFFISPHALQYQIIRIAKIIATVKTIALLTSLFSFMAIVVFVAYMKHFADVMKGNTDLYIFLYALINNGFSKLKTLSLSLSPFHYSD